MCVYVTYSNIQISNIKSWRDTFSRKKSINENLSEKLLFYCNPYELHYLVNYNTEKQKITCHPRAAR